MYSSYIDTVNQTYINRSLNISPRQLNKKKFINYTHNIKSINKYKMNNNNNNNNSNNHNHYYT